MKNDRGSVVIYVLLAMILLGVLIKTLMDGPQTNVQTQKLGDLIISLRGDINVIEASVGDCRQVYPEQTDIDGDGDKDAEDNPNPPFPLVFDPTSGYAKTGDIMKTVCPGASPTPLAIGATPSIQQKIISGARGRRLEVLGKTTIYTTTYTTDATEGIYLKIARSSPDTLWREALGRLDKGYSACKAAIVTAPGECQNGCFYYWLLRRDTSVLGAESGCP